MSPALVMLLVQAGLTYGPQFITDIKTLLAKTDVTIADIEALFANVKPYAAYGIPDNSIPTTQAGLPTKLSV